MSEVGLDRLDLVRVLGTTGAAALAVSLGVDPGLAVELAGVAVLLQLVAVLLRAEPAHEDPAPAGPDAGAVARAESAVASALAGPWGVQGSLRRSLHRAVRARLARRGEELEDVQRDLPPVLAAVLAGRWEHDRGLTPEELDEVLRAVERLSP